jgi:eukaryotic-like serine/threonine-protein kinase
MGAPMRYCPSCGARFSNDGAFCPHDGSATEELPEEPTGDPLLGAVIDGRYQVEARIGEGGMGIVYLAIHTVLGKRLALKVLRGEMARDADVVQRFIQEAQTASSIGHPNIVDINDFGRLPDGAVYFVMEYLDGEALTDLIGRGGSLPMREAILIIQQIASALGAAHARGIVHRDLKPDNVFILRRQGEPVVKVLDFGIAKVGGAGAKLTRTGMVFGTPHYMSPEQAAGQGVDGRTDIYALGIIMYEMFTGRVPFDADTFMGILSKHMFESPIPPGNISDGRQLGALEDVILHALAKKPEQRYPDMEALLADLARVQAGGEVNIGGRPGVRAPTGLANALEPPSRTEMRLGGVGRLPQRRWPLLLAAGAGLLVLVGGAVGIGVAFLGTDARAAPDATAIPVQAAPAPPTAEPPTAPGGLPAGREPPPEPSLVEVTSDPPGAKAFVDGALVGNTPVKLPRPEDGGERKVTVKSRGHLDGEVTLMASSADTVHVELEPEPRPVRQPATRAQPRPQPRPARTQAAEAPAPAPAPPQRRPMVTQEVVDPWAN